MFKLQPNPTFKGMVGLSVPGQDKPARVEMEFRWLGRDALKAYFESLPGKTDAEALAEIVSGWTGVDVPYSPEALAALIDNYPSASMEIFNAYRRELLEAREKN